MAFRGFSLTLSLLTLVPGLIAAPAPNALSRRQEEQSGGDLRGGPDLLGKTGSPVDSPEEEIEYELVPGQEADKDLGFYLDFTQTENPQPYRGDHGYTDAGPRTTQYDEINSDLFAPPGTDQGDIPNAKWPFGLSHNRAGLDNSGWARNQNVDVLPVATAMAGVNMRLAPYAYREMHWHKAGEWALMLNGSVRVQAIDEDGKTFVDDLNEGDVWFFPPGIPHNIQAFENGTEFLLVFDDGEFSEEETFLATEVMLRNPQAVLAKTLESSVDEIKEGTPDDQKWIFNGTPQDADISTQTVVGPAGEITGNASYTYHFSEQEPYTTPGGSVKIIDPQTFPIASKFSAALVTLKPGAIREYHWHLNSDEWTYFLSGTSRVTVYKAPEASRTFDFTAGDVAYIPYPQSHYIENVGDEDVVVLEVLQAEKFADISLSNWMSLTPKQFFKDTLGISDAVLDRQPKEKTLIKPGSTNLLETDFRPESERGTNSSTSATESVEPSATETVEASATESAEASTSETPAPKA